MVMLTVSAIVALVHLEAASVTVDALQVEPPPPVPIVGGVEVPLGRWDAVAGFRVGVHFCSGTMVAPRLLLTAAHCLTGLNENDAENIVVAFGPSIYAPLATTSASSFGVFEDFCQECTRDRFDLGYVLLRDAVTLPEGFPPLVTDQATWDAVMVDGEPLTAVGYGQVEDGSPSPGNTRGLGIKREVMLEYRGFSSSGLDFRAGGNGQGTCSGDSGGPAFVQRGDGAWAIAGVLSGGFGECGDGGLFIVPLPALPWIRDETGIDLLPPGCADAECVDTSLAEDGCGCRHAPGRTEGIGVLLFLLALGRPTASRLARERARC